MAKTLAGLRVAMVATDGVEQVELTSPKRALEGMGVSVDVIAPHGGRIRAWKHTEWGDHIDVDRTIDAANADDYDGLVLPGGVMNPDRLRRDPRVLAFVRHFFDENKVVAVICHGAWTLIDAGVVKDRHLTSYPSIRTDLVNAGARWDDRQVVIDGNLISSRKPDDLPAFEDALLGALESPPKRMHPAHAPLR
ncbi:MAG TPA: type 1 glutamine amidotransferase domain-containing protein [Sandaracinaceae bacterium]